jgi:hypothetical protein
VPSVQERQTKFEKDAKVRKYFQEPTTIKNATIVYGKFKGILFPKKTCILLK